MGEADELWPRLVLAVTKESKVAIKSVLDEAISARHADLAGKSFEEKLNVSLLRNEMPLRKFLFAYELQTVFPRSGCPGTYENFDVGIIFRLIQYFVGTKDWHKENASLPSISNLHDFDLANASQPALVQLLRDYRNFVLHHPSSALSAKEFDYHWHNLLSIFKGLGHDVTKVSLKEMDTVSEAKRMLKTATLDGLHAPYTAAGGTVNVVLPSKDRREECVLSEAVLYIVSQEIGPEWRILGRLLNVSVNVMRNIDADERQVSEKAYQAMRSWIQSMENASDRLAVLCNVLAMMNRKDIVAKLLEQSGVACESVIECVGAYSMKLIEIQFIGSGAFGEVFLCEDVNSGKKVARKVAKIGRVNRAAISDVEKFRDEIRLLEKLNHHRIVKFYGAVVDTKSISIIMEYMPGGSIYEKMITLDRSLTEDECRKYCQQILEGLVYLHGEKVIHRDIKGANILLDAEDNCKLADFGVSRQIQETCSLDAGVKSLRGTPHWMSPELVTSESTDKPYGRKTDIWSFGCTMVEMLTTKTPWLQLDALQALYAIGSAKSVPLNLPSDISDDCRQMIDLCLQINPDSRPSASDLLKHPFVCVDMDTMA